VEPTLSAGFPTMIRPTAGSAASALLPLSAVRAAFFSFLGYFLTMPGIVVMGILDASMVFFLPFGIDFVVILMTARKPEWFWLYALLATAGSVIGAAGTYWAGRMAGEKGLSRFVKAGRLERVKASVNRGSLVVAGLALVPPPFPFTPFVLASGALGMNPWSFFGALAGVRLLRFGVEGALAHRYGTQIVRWMKTPTFQAVVGVFIALAVIGTIVSAVLLVRSSRRPRGDSAAWRRRRRTAPGDPGLR
jgi:membrane protein YqaA with SNARE-associated domain